MSTTTETKYTYTQAFLMWLIENSPFIIEQVRVGGEFQSGDKFTFHGSYAQKLYTRRGANDWEFKHIIGIFARWRDIRVFVTPRGDVVQVTVHDWNFGTIEHEFDCSNFEYAQECAEHINLAMSFERDHWLDDLTDEAIQFHQQDRWWEQLVEED